MIKKTMFPIHEYYSSKDSTKIIILPMLILAGMIIIGVNEYWQVFNSWFQVEIFNHLKWNSSKIFDISVSIWSTKWIWNERSKMRIELRIWNFQQHKLNWKWLFTLASIAQGSHSDVRLLQKTKSLIKNNLLNQII